MRDGLPVDREVLAHCQVSQTAVPYPASTRDADNTPQAPLLAWDIVDTNHGRWRIFVLF